MDRNSRSRQAQILNSTAKFFKAILSDASMKIIVSEITALAAGKRLVDLPEEERLYSAAEIGEMCGGVKANMIECLADELGLKVAEYGMFTLNKSPNGEQILTFLYRQKAVDKIMKFLEAVKIEDMYLDAEDEEFNLSGFFI